MRAVRRMFLSLAAASLALNTFAAAPSITHISPSAVVPGKTTGLTFLGENLQSAVDLWTSFPCDVASVKSSNTTKFELKLPTQTTAGIGAIRLIATNGLSSLHLVLIDPLPTVEASLTNHSSASAQKLSRLTAVDGVCEELRSDFYRITAKKGDLLSIETVAQRIGSPLDPLLRLLDAQGRELAANDDAPGLGADAKLDFRCAKSGDYFIEIRDTRHAGSPRHRYRLRFGEPLPVPLPFNSASIPASLAAGSGTNGLIQESEPNDTPPQAQRIILPANLAGRFAVPGDRDVFRFEAGMGERVVITGRSRSLGSPCDLFLQLQHTNGTKIAEANATTADEGVLTNRFEQAGTYQIAVEELNRGGGPLLNYSLSVRALTPGFTLRTETERLSLPAGETTGIEVQAVRQDYDGPIHLSVVGLPEDFAITSAVMAAKTNVVRMQITAPEDLPLGKFFHFAISGNAEISGADVAARVSTKPALRVAFPELRHPPAELDGAIALSIAESASTNPKAPARKKKK